MPLIYAGLPFLRDRELHTLRMPNRMNYAFSYYYFALVCPSPLHVFHMCHAQRGNFKREKVDKLSILEG